MVSEIAKAIPCPKCGVLSDQCISIDAGMRISLQEAGVTGPFPEKVCPSCYDMITSTVSQGMKLRMERDQREKNKMMMWKNRVHLIKNARGLMSQKAYSEAAVQYEKYLRVLEVVYSLKRGDLSPAVFNNSSRSKELTVVASVYWDLLRIYDSNPRYGDRMQTNASKLAQFLPFSPIYPDIVKKAEAFARTAKNPAIIRGFLRACKSSKGPCFIADAAFAGEPDAVELFWLRQYRDQILKSSLVGRQFVWIYYKTSPPLARWLSGGTLRTAGTRWIISRLAGLSARSLTVVREGESHNLLTRTASQNETKNLTLYNENVCDKVTDFGC